MKIDEIFPNPTVKQVIFQIRYPNLFYLENKIGDLQLKIMKSFPKSSMILRRHLLFANVGPEFKRESVQVDGEKEPAKKIWQFKSENDVELNILTDSLDISSTHHKTYNLGSGDKFRDVIEFVLSNFFEVVAIPIITRIGFRYIDECPIIPKDNDTFKSYFNSVLHVDRFELPNVDEMEFKSVTKKDKYNLRYIEKLKIINDNCQLILDFDAFAKNIQAKDYLEVTDDLHTIINEEYKKTIKEPVYAYMRKPKED